jgi:signal transduction histidine kinase/DNA-binding response OmpR family regulator
MSSEDRVNVLLVDDKPENLLAMESVLAEPGLNLVSVQSAGEALRFLLIEEVALVLLDVQMPGLNGFELAELIREREKTQHTPIIFISAQNVDEQYVFKGYALGAVDYITKPFKPEILRSKVTFFTKLFRQNQEIKRQASLLEQINNELDGLNADLEARVARRTAELEAANQKLEREVEIRRESEARLAIEHSITRTLAQTDTIEAAAPAILLTFCEYLGAEISALWLLDEATERLRCIHLECPERSERHQRFLEQTMSARSGRGVGLPGQVWLTGTPLWVSNSFAGRQYPRSKAAKAAGLDGAMGLPIQVGSVFYGVIEFLTEEPIEMLQREINMMEAIGSEIGQFIYRKRVEADRESLLLREKAARQQAEKASRLKDEFLATVSHELRTPLNSILGWGQLLHLGKLNDEEKEVALETIHRNAKSQAQLIDDLLDTSRLITGNLQLELSPTTVAPLIDAAVDVVRPAAEAKRVTVNVELEADVETITCDSQRLQQMVWNLLTNAVKFTPPGGTITVRYERVDDSVRIVVADTGAGIAPEFLPFVFDRFSQEDSSSTRTHDGLGLGLAIVRHLAELHGGSVTVVSDGTGMGSTFAITIPLASVADPMAAASDVMLNKQVEAKAANSDLSGLRVLIVDDDKDTCRMLKFALGGSGAEVKTSYSANEAFDSIAEWPPHILLTDINMPGQDGYYLLNKIRQMKNSDTAKIPVIALTALARPEDGEKAVSAGFQLHMPKPVDIYELTTAIASLAAPGNGNK